MKPDEAIQLLVDAGFARFVDNTTVELSNEGWVWLKCLDCGCAWQSCQDSDTCPECGSHNHDIMEDEHDRSG